MFAKLFFSFLDYGWVQWHTAFEMPAARAGFQYMFIYFKGPKPTVDIQLDDLYLGEILQRSDWKENSDILINKYRKRNVRLRFVLSLFKHSIKHSSTVGLNHSRWKVRIFFEVPGLSSQNSTFIVKPLKTGPLLS